MILAVIGYQLATTVRIQGIDAETESGVVGIC